MNSTGAHYILTTKRHITRALAARIDTAIKALDPSATFVRHYAPNSEIHGWIERPGDGTNEANWRKAKNREVKECAERMLGIASSTAVTR